MEYFQETFNFTENETVAILGAHSLGLARCAPGSHRIALHMSGQI